MVLILRDREIREVIEMDWVIRAMEEVFREHAKGGVMMPVRMGLEAKDHNGTMLVMPAYVKGQLALGAKLVTVYPNNPSHGLPTILGSILLLDPTSGSPLAFLDASYITAMRTGATSAVATKFLAGKDSENLAVIGSGTQARIHIMALSRVIGVRKVRVFSPNSSHRRDFVDLLKRQGFDAMEAKDARESVEDAHVICTTTTSREPILYGKWVGEGTHINAVGAHSKDARELDDDIVLRSKIVVDSLEAAVREAGEILIPMSKGLITKAHIYAELGEIVLGLKDGRVRHDEITVFKSLGLAMEDLVVAKEVYERARTLGLGSELGQT